MVINDAKTYLTELVVRAQSGDESSKEKIYEEMANRVYYFALKIVRNKDDAADIMQDSFIIAFRKLDSLKEPGAFTTWLYRITANQCKNFFAKQKDTYSLDNDDENFDVDSIKDKDETFLPGSAIEQEETHRLVQEIIDELPDYQRSCIMMYYYSEMSVKEIAETLECSEGTVKSRLNYGRQQIKKGVMKLENNHATKLYNVAPIGLLIATIKNISSEELLVKDQLHMMWNNIFSHTEVIAGVSTTGATVLNTASQATAKKSIFALIKGKLVIGIAASAVVIVSTVSLIMNTNEKVIFSDPVVESGIRYIIHKSKGDIYTKELSDIKQVTIWGEYWSADLLRITWHRDDKDEICFLKGDKDIRLSDLDKKQLEGFGIARVGQVKSLKDLKYLENLERIEIKNLTTFSNSDYEVLNEVESLESINIELGSSITKLPNFKKLSNLTMAAFWTPHLDSSPDMDISNIAAINHISFLTLNIFLNNLEPIKELGNLESLDVCASKGRPLDGNYLKNMTKLKRVNIYTAESFESDNIEEYLKLVKNKDVIEALPNIEEIYVNQKNILKN